MKKGCGFLSSAVFLILFSWSPLYAWYPPVYMPGYLTGASVHFQTTNENKDWDTNVSVAIVCGNQTVAFVSGTFGEFRKGFSTGWIGLGLYQYPTKAEIAYSCYAKLVEAPVGHDEWHFNWTLVLNFSDGTYNNYIWPGNVDWDRTTLVNKL